MVVNGHQQQINAAVLSLRHKSYFFAGFNRTIEDCALQGSFISADQGTGAIFTPLNVCLQLAHLCLLHQAGQDTEQELSGSGRRNLLLLQMSMLRVLLTKTVSLSTIVTIRALLR